MDGIDSTRENPYREVRLQAVIYTSTEGHFRDNGDPAYEAVIGRVEEGQAYRKTGETESRLGKQLLIAPCEAQVAEAFILRLVAGYENLFEPWTTDGNERARIGTPRGFLTPVSAKPKAPKSMYPKL